MLTVLLISCIVSNVYQGCYGQAATVNEANGVYSTKVESDGIHLTATSTFIPIDVLTLSLHFRSTMSVFVNYQIAVDSSAQFSTKLQVTRDNDGLTNAGSIVHYHTQNYKTATGYFMDNLEPGHYTFEVHYKATSTISMSSSTDYQAAILQVMWFAGVHAVSDGVTCYPTHYSINRYGVHSPIKDLKVTLLMPYNGVMIAAYQLSIYSSSCGRFKTRLHMNNEQLTSTTMMKGNNYYYSLNSLWMDWQYDAEYEFGVTYQNYYSSYFEDCQNNYQGNKNLYAMYLPSNCRRLVNLRPTSSLSLSTSAWMTTDLSSSFTLYQDEHIFVRYQYTAYLYSYIITRLVIDSVAMKHTASITGNDYYHGNSGMWQGVLNSGTHTVSVEHRSGSTYTSYNNDDTTRAMDVIACG